MAEFKQSTCGCFDDCGGCMFGWCCSPCQVYQNGEALGKSGFLCCLLGCLLPCVPALLLRQEARERWGIEGSTGDDVVSAVCCTPCVNCQISSEIKEREGK